MRGWLVLTAALGAGCSSFPVFQGAEVSVSDDQAGTVVQGPAYQLTFSKGGYRYPTSLLLGDTEVLAGAPTDCTDESGMGLALHPATRIDGTATLPPGASATLTPVWIGPLASRVEIQWAVGQCPNGTALAVTGTSTFTFVGDRISRLDEVRGSSNAPSDQCACTGLASFWQLTSFTSFQSAWIDELVGPPLPTDDGPGNNAGMGACIGGGGHHVAFGWPDTTTRVRHVPLGDGNRSLAFVYDLLMTPDAIFRPPMKPSVTTMVINNDASCDELQQRAIATATSPRLAINGAPIAFGLDGVYGGHSKAGDVPPTVTSPVTLSVPDQTVPAGFLVWLDFGTAHASYAIHRSPEIADRKYRFQPIAGTTQALFWFPDALAPGETITIEAQ